MTSHFGNRTLKAVWIGRSADVGDRIEQAIKDFAVKYDRWTPDLNMQQALESVASADVVFIEIDEDSHVERLEALTAARKSEQRVVAITSRFDQHMLRRLIRLSLSDWLMADAGTDEIIASCEGPKAIVSAKGPRNVIVFTPVLGGMGATTLAIEAALQLSREGKEATCLVDLDFYAGECADFLNIEAKLAIDSLAKNTDAIDEHLLASVLTDHNSKIKLLAAQTSMGAHQAINSGAVLHLLNLVSAAFTNVVIDLPRAWQPWTDDVIIGSDAIFLISDGSVPALRAARRQLEEYSKRYGGRVKPHVIVNKHDRAWFSSAIREKDLRESLGDAFVGTIIDETKLAREAIDRGVPISGLKKNATLVKDLHTIIKKHSK